MAGLRYVQFNKAAEFWSLTDAASWIALNGEDGLITEAQIENALPILFALLDDGIEVVGIKGGEVADEWKPETGREEKVPFKFGLASTDPGLAANGDGHWFCWITPGDEEEGDTLVPVGRLDEKWTNLRLRVAALLARRPDPTKTAGTRPYARGKSKWRAALLTFIAEVYGEEWPLRTDEQIAADFGRWVNDPSRRHRFSIGGIHPRTVRRTRADWEKRRLE